MSYLLFLVTGSVIMLMAAKGGYSIDDTTWICLAILSAGEAIAIRKD